MSGSKDAAPAFAYTDPVKSGMPFHCAEGAFGIAWDGLTRFARHAREKHAISPSGNFNLNSVTGPAAIRHFRAGGASGSAGPGSRGDSSPIILTFRGLFVRNSAFSSMTVRGCRQTSTPTVTGSSIT